ncbi:MAG TPA: CHASE domain-containing protein, partial [Burkholderiaceae bacterium]|nr:CHASE domain-containing protein [Burkholderiaceae bacterium]
MKRWHAGLAGPVLLLAVGGLAAAWVQQRLTQNRQAQIEQRFEAATEAVLSALQDRMRTYEYGLRGARGAVIATSPELMDRGRFRAYMASRDLASEFPGARGFGLIRRIPVAAEQAFLDAARSDGWPGFSIRQISPQDRDRLVIQYLEPIEGNEAAIGLDISSEPHRRDAAQMAVDSGSAILSQPITLSQAAGKPGQGLLFLLPIYGAGLPLDTVSQRRKAAYGLVYAPLAMDEILQNLGAVPKGLLLRVSDAAQASGLPPLYISSRFALASGDSPAMDRILPVYGRPWRVEARTGADFMPPDDTLSPGGAALLTLTTFGLLALLLYVGQLALQRRRQGQAGMARLAAIVESS